MSDRSFTIDAIYRQGNKIRYSGGRYISSTPSGAARKAFSQASRHMRNKGRLTLEVHMRETTQGSSKKIFKYKVSRINESTEIQRNGETIVYMYSTKVKAM